jgi:hypothetical protein
MINSYLIIGIAGSIVIIIAILVLHKISSGKKIYSENNIPIPKIPNIDLSEVNKKLDEVIKMLRKNKKNNKVNEPNEVMPDEKIYEIVDKIDQNVERIENSVKDYKDNFNKFFIAWDYSSHTKFRVTTMSKFLKISPDEVRRIKDDLIKDGII